MNSTVQNARAVNAEISTLIDGSVSSVRGAYIKAQVDAEVKARGETFTKAMDKLKSLQGDLKKIKADDVQITFQGDQKVETEVWKKDTLKKRDELLEKVKKLDEAISNYLSYEPPTADQPAADPNKDPYKLLKEMLNKLGDQKPAQA